MLSLALPLLFLDSSQLPRMSGYLCFGGLRFFNLHLLMLVMARHTNLAADVAGAISAVPQRCVRVWEEEKEKGFAVFPRDALNLGPFFILEIHASAGNFLLKVL